MKTVTILFTDYGILKKEAENELCSKYSLLLFDFIEEFSKQLWLNHELSNEVTSYLKKDEVVPTDLLDRFFIESLKNIDSEKVLLSNYPRTGEQYSHLEDVLRSLGYSIESLWYIKKRNSFEDRVSSWEYQRGFKEHKEDIAEIIELSKQHTWYVVEVTTKEELTQRIERCD